MSNSLREAAGRYLRFARENPAMAGDANALQRLEDSLYGSLDEGFVTLTAPNSPWTWEVRTQLLGTDTDTAQVDFDFPFSVNVVGFIPIVVPIYPLKNDTGGNALPVATTDNIDVQIRINNTADLANSKGLTTVTGRGGNTYVTLTSIGIQKERTMGIRMVGDSKPTLAFTFRWKQPPLAGPPVTAIFQDTFITLAILAYDATRGLGNQTSKGIRGT